MGNPPLVVHLVYKRMAGGIQKIVAAKTKKIGKQGLILGLTHLTHSLDEKGSGFFLMHPVSNAADMIFENKIIKEDVRAVQSDAVQLPIFPDDFFYFFRHLPVYFLSKQIMCVCCWHFYPLLSYAAKAAAHMFHPASLSLYRWQPFIRPASAVSLLLPPP